jgi:hypothetical protein
MSLEEAIGIITSGDELTLTAVYSTGKRQGQIYSKICRYGATDGHDRKPTPSTSETTMPTTRKVSKFVDDGLIPLAGRNELTGRFTEFFSPQLHHIIMVNGVKIYK